MDIAQLEEASRLLVAAVFLGVKLSPEEATGIIAERMPVTWRQARRLAAALGYGRKA